MHMPDIKVTQAMCGRPLNHFLSFYEHYSCPRKLIFMTRWMLCDPHHEDKGG